MVEVIFDGIKDYGFLHSSHFITDAVIEATRLGLPSMREYFDARLKNIEHFFQSKTQPGIKKDLIKKTPGMGEYGCLHAEIWVPESTIKDEIFDKTQALQPMELQFLDMPYIFS